MPQLRCYKNCCSNNYCSHCVREGVKIGFDSMCKTYYEKNESNKDSAKFEYEFAQELDEPVNLDGHSVACDNEVCFYCEAGICSNDHIRIDDKPRGPLCSSFLAK